MNINRQIIRIGTNPQCEIIAEGEHVSEFHASLYLDGEMICLETMPGNNVVLNGNEVEGKFWVAENDDIIVGSTRLSWVEINFLMGLNRKASFTRYQKTPLDASAAIDEMPMGVPIRRNYWWIPLTICVLAVLGYLGYRVCELYRETNQHKSELQRIDSMIMENDRQTDSIFKMY